MEFDKIRLVTDVPRDDVAMEVTTTVEQDGEKTATNMRVTAKWRLKKGWLYIRYCEANGASVLVKWNQDGQIVLVRELETIVNRFVFVAGERVDMPYRTGNGAMILTVETSPERYHLKENGKLQSLEWSYRLMSDEQILGNYQVRLQLLS